MRWEDGRRSDNVEDARGSGGGRRPLVIGGGMGILGLLFLLLLMFLGVDPRILLQLAQGPGGAGQNVPGPNFPGEEEERQRPINPEEEKLAEFTSVVLASTEDVWDQQFKKMGRRYQQPKLRLFTGETSSACGFTSAAVGPFYCPGDDRVYLDLQFFDELNRRFNAPGDTAQAYVIAHEVGHHVQNQLGISDQVRRAQQRATKSQANELSVRLELQADYLAGVWAHYANKNNLLEPGDIEEAMRAAAAIGDDRLQMQAQGYVVPDAFTHGSSEQRLRWFREGFRTGDMKQLDRFFEDDEL